MKPQECKIVNPAPFFKITFGCSNRAFYSVKEKLWEIAGNINIELNDGYITKECDYEGDLERIIIYHDLRAQKLIKAVLDYYNISQEVEIGMDVVLSIF